MSIFLLLDINSLLCSFFVCLSDLHNYKSYYLLAIKAVLRIENTKHPLIQLAEEFLQGHFQINVSILVVILKVFEEVRKDVRVSFV